VVARPVTTYQNISPSSLVSGLSDISTVIVSTSEYPFSSVTVSLPVYFPGSSYI